ncbi:MAG: HAMP domain-containing histidine kinase, partial [Planctomycetes bacterium]|nr:HAMP domain-containing histidine kinase [Planctomycetota bacterium]
GPRVAGYWSVCPEGLSPEILSLVVAWGCVLVAAAAVGVLLWGAVSLGQRRGTFVSAVTHELRTPLTTFRMYTEMLAEDMVPDDKKRRRYIETLQAEAKRLSHLVENVLSYSRLENSRATAATETIVLRDFLRGVEERLGERERQAGMTLVVEEPDAGGLCAEGDSSAVLQILFNLVDNACKYASRTTDRRIHIELGRAGGFAVIKVRDHGPGIARKNARRFFRPFCKSAREAADSAPGVGLGLAISRRLARRMGGDLRLDRDSREGASFILMLPACS